MSAYYNEIDPFAAQWLRNLIAAGHIAPGDVDERSIEDVCPDDLRPYTQCHFFAGIGVWSLALRRAGWDDSRPVWTGSCPCQPFSAAGKGAGFDDERHLWPAFFQLIAQCRPAIVLGEQVASGYVGLWVDLVQSDLEALGYAFGAVPFPSASVGAPHIRDRLYWVADSLRSGSFPRALARVHCGEEGAGTRHGELERPGSDGRLGNTCSQGLDFGVGVGGVSGGASGADPRQATQRASVHPGPLADASGERLHGLDPLLQWEKSRRVAGDSLETSGRGPVNGFWRGADWISCRDDRWRPVEPGTFPLANGAPSRVGRLRAYGNAINAKAAQTFIECLMP